MCKQTQSSKRIERHVEVKIRECTGNKFETDSLGILLEVLETSAENEELFRE